MDNNRRTIDSYNQHVHEYIDGTPHEASGDVKNWLDRTFADIGTDAHVLELGSAFGRDALYLQSKGYTVICTDATPAFVDLLNEKGLEAQQLNALTDEFPEGLDVVLANAVLLHFQTQETELVAKKIYDALKEGGRFALSLKHGSGEEWSDEKLGAPRYFRYWNSDEIAEVLQAAGFSNVTVRNDETMKWLHVIAEK